MRRQLVRVLGRDLRERAMPVAAVVAAIGQPLGGVLETVEQILRGHLGRSRLCRQCDRCDDDDQQSAHDSPLTYCGLRIADCGLNADCGLWIVDWVEIRDPQSAISIRSAIRNPQSALGTITSPPYPRHATWSDIPPDR